MDLRLQHRERDAHVGWMHRDAGVARAEDRVHAIVAVDGGAAAARLAFVAGRRGVVEVVAARALQEIAAGRRHVAQLLRGAGHDRAGEHRIALLDQRVIGEIGVAHERADAQAAAGRVFDLLQRQPRDVDQLGRPFDVHLHQIDQIGAAGDEFRVRIAGDLAYRVRDVVGARVLEVDHDSPHRLLDCRDDVGVGAAAADVAAHELADFVRGLCLALGDQPDRRADLPRRAIAALERVMVDERLLQRMQRAVVRQAFDRGDLRAIVHDGERQARIDAPAVDQHGAGAALALIAALFRAGQVEMLAQQVEQCRAGIER